MFIGSRCFHEEIRYVPQTQYPIDDTHSPFFLVVCVYSRISPYYLYCISLLRHQYESEGLFVVGIL